MQDPRGPSFLMRGTRIDGEDLDYED